MASVLKKNIDPRQLTFIVPSKRAVVFLKDHYIQLNNSIGFLPKFYSIEEFIEGLSGIKQAPNLVLLFELYDCYKTNTPNNPDNFETFLGWGQTLLQDFNEIDRYLIEPDTIFPYIKAIKEIDHWSLSENLTPLQESHLSFWKTLGSYYYQYKKHLLDKEIGYQGLVYIQALENLELYIQNFRNHTHVFAGFNALNKAEERIIQEILHNLPASIFWDTDKAFLQEKDHDASLFLKSHFSKWNYYKKNTPEWISNNFENPKNIEITGLPKNINQAKYISNLLNRYAENGTLKHTAVVLSDEQLLLPLLSNISNEIEAVNITMGYPLQETPIAPIFSFYFKLFLNEQKEWYYKDIIGFLSLPQIAILFDNKPSVTQNLIQYLYNNNISYVTNSTWLDCTNDSQVIKTLHWLLPNSESTSPLQLIQRSREIINSLKNYYSQQSTNTILLEYLFRFYELFNQLEDLQLSYGFISSTKSLYRLYTDILTKESLDFKGEPLEGLQIMGMLESRNLDFENLIIASVNEGILPSGKNNNSFIPYEVKKAVELPTYKEKDAIYAYHFYRLLQRAKNIHLLYNTEPDALNGGEKSRFLQQLESFSPNQHSIKSSILAPKITPPDIIELKIDKTSTTMLRLKEVAAKGFSPSSLAKYISNPMEFYQQYILGIREEETVEETVAANTMGTIVHAVLEEMYLPVVGQFLSEIQLSKMRSTIETLTLKHFQAFYKNTSKLTGKNLIIYEVIKKYIDKFLSMESDTLKKGITIKVVDVERKVNIPFKSEKIPFEIVLKGTVDRIDIRDGQLCIIDYKTGKVEAKDVTFPDWNELITNASYTKAFQLLTYAYMYTQENEVKDELEVGNISFKKLSAGFIPASLGVSRNKVSKISKEMLLEIELALEILLLEILNPEIPFKNKKIE